MASSKSITGKEREKRIRELLGFVFKFNFVFNEQISKFIKIKLEMKSSRRLIEWCLKEGYLRLCDVPFVRKRKVFYLSQRGLRFLGEKYPIHKYYFRKKRVNLVSIPHNSEVLKVYLTLLSFFKNVHWESEWIIRSNITGRERYRVPDGIFTLKEEIKIAVEVERTYKSPKEWERIISRYRRRVDKGKNKAVLVIALDSFLYAGISKKLSNCMSSFTKKYFFITTSDYFKKGVVFLGGEEVKLNSITKKINKGESD